MPYAFFSIALSVGPITMELPPGPIMGAVNDLSEQWVMDFGLPGPDAGKGGKHVILPPGYKGEAPAPGRSTGLVYGIRPAAYSTAKSYKLTVPLPAPAKLFWSVTIYDPETRSEIQTDQSKAALRSLVELKDMGSAQSVDLYFGPEAPTFAGSMLRGATDAPMRSLAIPMRCRCQGLWLLEPAGLAAVHNVPWKRHKKLTSEQAPKRGGS